MSLRVQVVKRLELALDALAKEQELFSASDSEDEDKETQLQEAIASVEEALDWLKDYLNEDDEDDEDNEDE